MSASFRGYDLNYVGLDDPRYYDAVWESLDAAHFLGADLHQRAMRRGLPSSIPFALIPPSIDTDFFSPCHGNETRNEARNPRELRLLSVGRLEWKKGYEYALMTVRHLLDRGIRVRYRIVGAGEYGGAVHFAIRQLGLKTAVEVMGALSPARVRTEMSATDVFLHAAVSEGFCNAVLEAQSMELPVVSSDADGLAENLVHGVTGFVVPRRDPEAMADAVETLAREPELRRRMGRAGRARVVERFQLPDQIGRFQQFYADLLGRSQPT
jgi:colanic acid/amylovoran biosynthesis glycosyltransferase